MIDILCIPVLWIISFLLYRMNGHYWQICKKQCLRTSSNCFYIDLIFQIFRMRIVLFYALPAITRFIFSWKNDIADHVTAIEIAVIYFMELVSHFIYYMTFVYFLRNNKKDLSFIAEKNKVTELLAIITLVLYCYFSITGFNLFSGAEEAPSDNLWMIKPLMTVVGSVSCFYIFVQGTKYWNKFIVVLAFITMILYLVLSFSTGIRGKIFWPILWLFFCAWVFKKEQIRKYSIWGVGILLLLVVFQGGMTAFRSDKITDVTESIKAIRGHQKDGSRPLLEEIDFRFGALTRYSVGFTRMVGRGYSAGLRPVLNSMYAPIPRRFMPDKPVPCSAEGDIYSMGMYLCSNEITKIETNMVEFSTAAHAYWELGLFGILFFSIIPAIYVFYSIRLFRRFKLLGPCFMMAIFKPWGYNDPKIWVSDIVLQLSQVVLVSFVILFLCKQIGKFFPKMKRNATY